MPHDDDQLRDRKTTPARASYSTENPIDRLLREHALQLRLCDALERIADTLPDRVDRKLLIDVIGILSHGIAGHFGFEEDILFPLLRTRGRNDSALMAALDQLEAEHGRDLDLGDELAEELHVLDTRGEASNVEMLAYMLRGFFEGQRRHIEWENAIVLPAARRHLTEDDIATLVQRGAQRIYQTMPLGPMPLNG